MDSGIISGLVGGAISVVLMTYLTARLREQTADGTLRWGWGLLLLGFLCAAIACLGIGAFFYDDDVWTDGGEFRAVVGLIIGFGLCTIYCLVEYFTTHGEYDDKGIEFHTYWTGTKKEKWQDLESAKFAALMSWYVLSFRSGKIIRLATLLSGHHGVIKRLNKMGFEVD